MELPVCPQRSLATNWVASLSALLRSSRGNPLSGGSRNCFPLLAADLAEEVCRRLVRENVSNLVGSAPKNKRPTTALQRDHQAPRHCMTKDEKKDSITTDGLRYRSKTAGSPFGRVGPHVSATKSCYFCGKHRTHASLQFRRLLGKSQAVCAPSCKELDALLDMEQNAVLVNNEQANERP